MTESSHFLSPPRFTRRALLIASAAMSAVGGAMTAAFASPSAADPTPPPSGPFSLPPLPYADNALDPVISATTLSFHYGKHHKAYVDNLNKAVVGTPMAELPLEQIVKTTYGVADKTGIYNNASQDWNHTFYWKSLRAQGGGAPPPVLQQKIDASFGSLDALKKEWLAAATSQFGSGWAWLVLDNAKLKIVKTADADTPLTQGSKPLLTIDVWEHAYYLDYQNRRVDYVNAWLGKLANWEFATENLGAT